MEFLRRVNDAGESLAKMLRLEDDDNIDGNIETYDFEPEIHLEMNEETETALLSAVSIERCSLYNNAWLKTFDKLLSLVDSFSITMNPDGTINFAVTIE